MHTHSFWCLIVWYTDFFCDTRQNTPSPGFSSGTYSSDIFCPTEVASRLVVNPSPVVRRVELQHDRARIWRRHSVVKLQSAKQGYQSGVVLSMESQNTKQSISYTHLLPRKWLLQRQSGQCSRNPLLRPLSGNKNLAELAEVVEMGFQLRKWLRAWPTGRGK